MKRRTFVIGAGTATVGSSLLVGSSAFTDIEAQRDFTVEIVGDEDAYLRLVYSDVTIECEETVTLVEIGNQLKSPINIEAVDLADTDDEDIEVDNVQFVDGVDTLDVGDSVEVTVDASCTSPEEVTRTVPFDVQVEGDDVSVLANGMDGREIEITCDCPPLFPGPDISFIAFCRTDGDPEDVTVEAIEFKDEDGTAGDPVSVEWRSENDIDEIVVFTGQNTGWFVFEDLSDPRGGTITTRTDDDVPEEYDEHTHNFQTGDAGWEDRCPRSPCSEGVYGVKFDWEDDSFEDGESTLKTCP